MSVSEEQSGLRSLHSLSGIVPVGFFLVEHMVLAANALRGQGAFERTVVFVAALPAWPVLEALLILAPLAFHAFYGVLLIANKKERAVSAPYAPEWALVSRASAMIALVFIGYHFYELRVAKWFGGLDTRLLYTKLVADLSSTGVSEWLPALPWIAILYLLGIAATTLHFACGTWGFLVRRKWVRSPLGIRSAAYGSAALGIVLFALSAAAVISLATGSLLLPPHGAGAPPPVCPQP
jgi:succinate dehydrogenase/fumarate reductase cytochrome b subunit (b558 family)